MTFYEAALYVLHHAKRPLHFKKITEIAVRDDLLSHIGKTPTETMSKRLGLEAKKTEGATIVSKRPGVFGLSDDFDPETLPTPRPKKEVEAPKQEEEPEEQEQQEQREDSRSRRSSRGSRGGRRSRGRRNSDDRDEKNSSQQAAPKDDAPEQKEEKEDTQERSSRGSSRRRSRGRRSEQDKDASKTQQASEPQEPSVEKEEPEEQEASRERSSGRGRRGRRRRSSRQDAPSSSTQTKPANDAKRMAYAEDPELFDDDVEPTTPTKRRAAHAKHNVEPFALEGIAHAAYTVLSNSTSKVLKIKPLSDEIFNQKLIRFHTHNAELTVQSAMLNDNQLRKNNGQRPLFTYLGGQRWGLSEWGMSAAMLQHEKSIMLASEKCRSEAASILSDALDDIPGEAFEQLILSLLERVGYEQIKISKRGAGDDVFFSASLRQGMSSIRVCVQVVGDNKRALSVDDVTQLRGTLHHYGANEAIIVHLGAISRAANEEAQEEKLAPVTIIERRSVIDLMIQHGLGVRTYNAPVVMLDQAYLHAMQSRPKG